MAKWNAEASIKEALFVCLSKKMLTLEEKNINLITFSLNSMLHHDTNGSPQTQMEIVAYKPICKL